VLYVPYRTFDFGAATFVIGTRGEAGTVASALRRVAAGLEPSALLENVESLASIVQQDVAQPRFFLVTVGTFAVLSLSVALAGLYAVLAFGVRSRLFELGVRSALGATAGSNLWLVLRQGLILCTVGAIAGVAIALRATTLLGDVLFQTATTDPVAYVAAAAAALVTGIVAVLSPAIRAGRVDPMVALRAE
jgi:putative ABC transport system permease protein